MPERQQPESPPRLKILMVAPEVAPFVKVGGLADVLGSLPKALARLGHDVRIVCPLYGSIQVQDHWTAIPQPLIVNLGFGAMYGRVWETRLPGSSVPVYFIEHGQYFGRPQPYAGPWGDHVDNDQRFTFLSRASIDLCGLLQWTPDVFHAHDWTVGLVPVYLNTTEWDTPLGGAASVMTIHNLQFQGIFRRDLLAYAGLPDSVFHPESLEAMGHLNMLKGGLYHASKITTVSPTYAREIQTPEQGYGLNHVLRYRAADLIGILNGIDLDDWDPAKDPLLPEPFSSGELAGKAACKAAMQGELGLAVRPEAPVFGVVSRLYDQKGLDILGRILPRLVTKMDMQVAVLGSGDAAIEQSFRQAATDYPDKVGLHIGYNEGLAHRIYGGSDALLMPSRFEPCGLSQMYALRYGSLPVVRRTGGLADTVVNFDEVRDTGTGFVFEDATDTALFNTIGWAVATWYDRPEAWGRLVRQAMAQTFDWERSALIYSQVYEWACSARRARRL
ncbi:MAG: glycogen synthase GlgA [Opitutales bacterium]